MKLPIPTAADLIAIDEYSDVREYARREAERPDPTQVTPAPPVALPRPERRTPPPPPPGLRHSPPPPPPAAGTTYTGRSFWFTPSLAVAIGLCVVGVLALMRLGPSPAAEEMVARNLPAVEAAGAAEVTQVSAARDPEQSAVHNVAAAAPAAAEPQPPVSADCGDPAAPTLASAELNPEPEVGARPTYLRRYSTKGVMALRSSVPSAVYVDGRFVGNTPLRGLRLQPGKHDVALENAVTDQRMKFSVEATAGSIIQQSVRLVRSTR